jgi:predicted GH43/DUF377 family glycosyl hydrolase
MTTLMVGQEIELQNIEFVSVKTDFRERWHEKEKALEPLLPRVTYREFIPGFPILAPKELISSKDKEVSTDNIYNGILHNYHEAFENFLRDGLKLPLDAASGDIVDRLHGLMIGVEEKIDKLLLQGDITALEGTASVVEALFQNFPHSEIYAINPDVAAWILERHPPRNLLIRHGAASIVELGERYGPNDILALASLSEDPEHTARVWDWIMGNARPEHFALMKLEYLVERHEDFPLLTQTREPSYLDKLAGRIIITNLPKKAGGELPKLRYSLTIAKNIVESEYLGEIWKQFAQERKEFGTRVVNSLKGHWGVDALSAHNIFENKIQRRLIERLRSMIKELRRNGDSSVVDLTLQLNHLADCYHLTYSHPDGTFIPCSAWTWASFSFKGGEGVPTALSLHVERDWASRDFLVGILETLDISEGYMDRKITELIGRGMESESLARLMLPGWETVDEVKPGKLPLLAVPEARKLNRFAGNPILAPMSEHAWESKYVFNPGAIRLGDKVYILYRACSDDEVSRIGLAISSDGLQIEERLDYPIFEPDSMWEKRGCEDPRLVLFNGSIYMLYTAYDSVVAQIALASIEVEDFLNRRWDRWIRQGLVFPGFENKDATLFPEIFNGRYFMYHRIEPSIWVTSAERLASPWPSEEHRILLGPGVGTAWDGFKVGGGSQPIKTRYGWLLIYHGVDRSWIYRLGVLLVALDDPRWILYRSPNPILEPEETCELGDKGCYVPNVVFTCGAVPSSDKEILEDDDEILVYYGASDSVSCVATARVEDLIPQEIRQGKSRSSHQAHSDFSDNRQ